MIGAKILRLEVHADPLAVGQWCPGARERVGDVTETTVSQTVAEVMAELAALEDPKVLEVNRRHGDAHGVNLGPAPSPGQTARDAAGPRP